LGSGVRRKRNLVERIHTVANRLYQSLIWVWGSKRGESKKGCRRGLENDHLGRGGGPRIQRKIVESDHCTGPDPACCESSDLWGGSEWVRENLKGGICCLKER